MPDMISRFRFSLFAASPARLGVLVLGAGMAVVLAPSTFTGVKAQQSAPAPAADNQPAQQPSGGQSAPPAPAPAPEAQPAAQQPSNDQAPQVTPAPPAAPAETQPAPAPSVSQSAPSHASEPPEITEDEIRRLLTGKQLFLRGGYLDNALSYNEHGALIGHSPQGSYTLCGMEIDKVHLTKHKVELEGQRYGLHFLGALPYEDPTKAVDRVNITPKKKVVKITIDRELVVKPKEKKEKGNAPAPMHTAGPAQAAAPATAPAAAPAATPEGDKVQAEVAAAPQEDRASDEKSVTTTTSQAHANQTLRDALDNVFAQGFDSRMMASMPEFWKLYYEAAAAKTDYRPSDENVLRENMVDKKAELKTNFEPASNEYAQNHGVAGISLYHVVVGADGKAGEIAVARPIGFGLDENAVDAIRKAMFEPAMKDGKPVPVILNLVVEFRIYSKRTAVTGNPGNAPTAPPLPGPYSTEHQ